MQTWLYSSNSSQCFEIWINGIETHNQFCCPCITAENCKEHLLKESLFPFFEGFKQAYHRLLDFISTANAIKTWTTWTMPKNEVLHFLEIIHCGSPSGIEVANFQASLMTCRPLMPQEPSNLKRFVSLEWMQLKNDSVPRKICPSVMLMTLVGMNEFISPARV